MFEQEVTILTYTKSKFQGKDGKDIDYNYAVVLMAGSAYKLTAKVDLTSYITRNCVVELELKPDFAMKPKLTIVGVK